MERDISVTAVKQDRQRPLRLAILQRVCAGYRSALFKRLSAEPGIETMLFIGEDPPNSKVKGTLKMQGINHRKLKTRFLALGRRVLPWHVSLIDELHDFAPDVILCEGESHFVGYLQAIYYKIRSTKRVALMHWCFISLPGWPKIGGSGYRSYVKRFFRRFFDAFVVYSSFSKDCLIKLGEPSQKIFVATNVCDVEKFIAASEFLEETASEARIKLNLPDRFTVLYLGTLDGNKRPEIMLELAKRCADHNFVLLGSGELLDDLRHRVKREGLRNVFLPGRVAEQMGLYCRASDLLLVPGRGGIVISEAMAYGLPVLIHQADGTEYDLVRDGETGVLLSSGGADAFHEAISRLAGNPTKCRSMGLKGRQLLMDRFSTDSMAKQIVAAALFAKSTDSF